MYTYVHISKGPTHKHTLISRILIPCVVITECILGWGTRLRFVGPCIVIYFYSKTNKLHNISNLFYFGATLYMFRTVSPSIIRSLRLYIQQQVYVIQVLLPSSHRTYMTYTCCCTYSLRLLMMDGETVRNM